MRKTLLATTALAAAGAFAAGPVLAADMLSVGISGYMEQWVGGSSLDGYVKDEVEYEGGSGVHSDSEIHVKGKLTADSGFIKEFGVTVEIEANDDSHSHKDGGKATATTIDETFAWLGGDFGEVQIGAHDDAASLMHYGHQDVGVGMNAGDIKVWIPVTAQFNTSGWHGDRKSIIYYTPRFPGVGIQFGASYAPDVKNAEAGAPAHHNDTDAMSVGLNMKQNLGDASVNLSGGHYMESQTGAGVDDRTFSNFGLQVGLMGFGFNVAYAASDDGMDATDTNKDFDEFSVGAMYADGPMAVSLGHFQTDYDGGGDANSTMLSFRYTLAPGVESRTSVFGAEDSGGVEGAAFVTGIKIGF